MLSAILAITLVVVFLTWIGIDSYLAKKRAHR